MKLIVLLIIINIVFGGNCPPKEVFSPCDCEQVNYQIKYILIDSLNLNIFLILLSGDTNNHMQSKYIKSNITSI